MSEYVPGVCNIGPEEQKQRRRSGYIGIILGIAYIIFVIVAQIPAIFRVGVFFPASLAAVGFLQSYFHFCAAYGLAGLYNVARSVGKTDDVDQAEFRRIDRNKALKIILLSALAGLVTAAIAYIL